LFSGHSAISPSASLTLRDALEKCASAENSRQVSLVIDADDVVEKLGCKRLGQLRFLGFFSAEYLVGRQITVHQTGGKFCVALITVGI
jgi:hypothetical protein